MNATTDYAPDVLLPDSWYPHSIQSELIRTGIRMPVYAVALEQRLGLTPGSLPCNLFGMCYIAGLPNDICPIQDDMWRAHGSPIHDRYKMSHDTKMLLVLTPPLSLFDSEHRFGFKLEWHVDSNSAQPDFPDSVVKCDYLPKSFASEVTHIMAASLITLSDAVEGMNTPGFHVVGVRLNPLTSGLYNIAMFLVVKGRPTPDFAYQKYVDMTSRYPYVVTRGLHNPRIRVIPDPRVFMNGLFGDAGRVIEVQGISPKTSLNDQAHKLIFDYIQPLICKHLENVHFQYVKIDKAQAKLLIGVEYKDPNNVYTTTEQTSDLLDLSLSTQCQAPQCCAAFREMLNMVGCSFNSVKAYKRKVWVYQTPLL